jgi:hypothetical protein
MQQPYLNQGFIDANALFHSPSGQLGQGTYQPKYFGSAGTPYAGMSTVSPFNQDENNGMNWMMGQAGFNSPVLNQALSSSNNIAGNNFLSSNPGQTGYQQIFATAGNNTGNPIYDQVAQGAMNNPTNSNLSALSNSAQNNPAIGLLGSTATGQAQANNVGNNILLGTAAQGGIGNNALAEYASGQMLGSQNPAWQQLSDSVTASTLPALEGQFTQGGAMNNPNAQYAISNGLASALAPYAEQNYNTQTQNQLNAANILSGNALSGASSLAGNILSGQGLQAQSANNLGSQYLGGLNTALGAQGLLSSNYQTGLNQLLGAGQGLSSNYATQLAQELGATQGMSANYNTAVQQQIQNELALPGLSNAATSNAGTAFDVGQVQQNQSQNELNNLVNEWNYNQNLPLNMLNAYQSAVSGNYGSTGSLTQPYFQNSTANILGSALGGSQLASSLYNGLNNSGLFGGSSSNPINYGASSNAFNFAFNGSPSTNSGGYMTFGGS